MKLDIWVFVEKFYVKTCVHLWQYLADFFLE
jgi:hypothetical protein